MTGEKKRVEVCYSPNQWHLYKKDYEIAVVIDVLRATSAICAAVENGVTILPVSSLKEAKAYQDKGYLVAAERNGQIVEGFDMGNSPVSFKNPELKGKTVILTTTNGTKAINIAREKETVAIASLNNLEAICNWLIEQNKNVLLLGSGWKDKFNLEDTICAGAIADQLIESQKFFAEEDSTIAAKFIYRSAKENIFSFLKASSHRRRLRKLNLNEDIKYCLTPNTTSVVPILHGDEIIAAKKELVSE